MNIFTASTDEWMRERRRRVEAYEEEARSEFWAKLAMQPESMRKLPDIEFDYPPCPICTGDLEYDDGLWICQGCNVVWERDGSNGTRYE